MNRQELEELIDDYIFSYPYEEFPSYLKLNKYHYNVKGFYTFISESDYYNICNDKWMQVYKQNIISEGH